MTSINSPRRTTGRRLPPLPALRKLGRLAFVAAATFALAVFLTTLASADTGAVANAGVDAGNSPMAVTQNMINRALQIMANKSMPVRDRRLQLREAIESEFDFSEMSRSALGYHWRSLSPDDRSHFTQLFTAFIEDAYLSKIQDYSGQQVRFDGQTPLGQGYTQINTDIIQPGKSSIAVNYLLVQKDGNWKIYDVTVDAISIIANYRNQFNRVINEKGFPQLMADLRAKQQELASLLNG